MLKSSFESAEEMIRSGITVNLRFKLWNLNSYKSLYTTRDAVYFTWYKNSLIIVILYTIGSVFFCSMVGYGLAVYDFKGKNLIFIIVLITMTIPFEILILPLYKLSVTLKLINTYWGVILPSMVSPFAVFYFRQYAVGLPKELMDAGRIDGCTEYGIYFRIMIPIMKPAIGAMIVLRSLISWNSFMWPLIVMQSDNMMTLPVGLQTLITPYSCKYDFLLSGCVLSVIPIIILFLFNQKAFVSGLKVGAIKG
jgi:arabinosaccharide transport system permease protein